MSTVLNVPKSVAGHYSPKFQVIVGEVAFSRN